MTKIELKVKPSLNKKVRNATPTLFDGIQFKSKLEAYTYQELTKAGIETKYEETRFELIPAFIYADKKIRKMTYLPDFVGDNFIIECKGHVTESFPLRLKIFMYSLFVKNINYTIFIVRNHKQVDEMVKTLKTHG